MKYQYFLKLMKMSAKCKRKLRITMARGSPQPEWLSGSFSLSDLESKINQVDAKLKPAFSVLNEANSFFSYWFSLIGLFQYLS